MLWHRSLSYRNHNFVNLPVSMIDWHGNRRRGSNSFIGDTFDKAQYVDKHYHGGR